MSAAGTGPTAAGSTRPVPTFTFPPRGEPA